MLKNLVRGLSLFAATNAMQKTFNTQPGSITTIKGIGCGNKLEIIGAASFEFPSELGDNQPNCLFANNQETAAITNVCTGETVKKIDLKKNHLELSREENNRGAPADGVYPLAKGTTSDNMKNYCGQQITLLRDISVPLKKGQVPIFMGTKDDKKILLVDGLTRETITTLRRDIDYQLIRVETEITIKNNEKKKIKNEKEMSDEEMAAVYLHNRAEEIHSSSFRKRR